MPLLISELTNYKRETKRESEMGELGRVGAKCGRWNPTPEQVKVLTDLFRAGLRTPSTDQIQMISCHLSSLGSIESKNVFYWFQNHKARERHQKKRRIGSDPHPDHQDKREQPTTKPSYPFTCKQDNKTWERSEIETLELFPLTSYSSEPEKMKNECKDIPFFDFTEREIPFDLRLSYL